MLRILKTLNCHSEHWEDRISNNSSSTSARGKKSWGYGIGTGFSTH